jgi:Mn2+/Fe2+ NRAMP family transporter
MIGPGLVLAATGVGVGDLVAASVAGARFGHALMWAVVVGALLKFVLSEGLARWQLATGTTLVEGWVTHLGGWVRYLFLGYLIIWSFIVGGALVNACGIAAHALAPGWSFERWGTVHSLVAAAVVLLGGYRSFERLIKVFIGVMFLALVGCALTISPPARSLFFAVHDAALPEGGIEFAMAVMGGVGGSVTLLSYGYWIREKRWEGQRWLRVVRVDLAVAYLLTGVFGLAVMVLAAQVLHGEEIAVRGSGAVLQMAEPVARLLGEPGRKAFLVGFWGAVATSMLGVWQGVPYLFCDFVGLMRRMPVAERRALVGSRSWWYRGFLAWLSLPTISLLHFDRPVTIVVVYSVLGALFMPFLAGTLLYMNRRVDWVGHRLCNRLLASGLLTACLLLFGYLFFAKLLELL